METLKTDVHGAKQHSMRRVLASATLGTLFEWYDFYLYGTLATVFSTKFFSGVSETAAFIYALLAFGIGFASRPIGALIFGRLGDMLGRKHTFLITMILMGVSTLGVGLLPTYATVGGVAPILLVCLRVLQGIGIGGEYGGAAIFVAEHSPRNRRGSMTSWIQLVGGVGMLMALAIVFLCRQLFGASFDDWGWRVPFLLSGILLAISIYIRLSVSESPLFLKMKTQGKTSKAPIRETLTQWRNLKAALIAVFGLVGGVTVVTYTALIYLLFFLTRSLRLDETLATHYVLVIMACAMPLYVGAGVLSDWVGRKPLILGACLVSALTIFPTFRAITHAANPALEAARTSHPVTVVADQSTCSVQFDLLGRAKAASDCDRVKQLLAKEGIPYTNEAAETGAATTVRVGDVTFLGAGLAALREGLSAGGYRDKADPTRIDKPVLWSLIFFLFVLAAMTYGPLAAALVDLFPARIRYTALSFPYQLAAGLVGGFFPSISFAIVAQTGDIYSGLWYPAFFSMLTAIVGFLFLPTGRVEDEALDSDLASAPDNASSPAKVTRGA
ncbi:sugar transport protein [Paraburkholderia silvatlantica]|uniref:Sugar transport protein n=1 Tax=Paraburkholderia silvatlantica TaxID=321895 RepID=A0A2V4UBP0_9BURK|nr:MFS transporter [Paraburkholderia silvatlantica]PYE25490.1 sugar transport protein [Paraburkholderia silvatlantica]